MSKLWLIGLAASAAWAPAAMAQGAPPPPPPPPMAHGAHAPGAPMMMHPGMNHPMPGHDQMDGQMSGMHRDWDDDGDLMSDESYDGYYAEADHGRGDDHDRGDWDDGRRGHHDRGDSRRGYGREEVDRVVNVLVRRGGLGDDCRRSCTRVRHMPRPPHPGYGYGYGQGYGYGYGYGAGCGCGPVVITETTTTTAPVVEMRTYYETVYEHRAAPRRHYSKPVVRHYSKPVVRRSVKARAAAPRPGERG